MPDEITIYGKADVPSTAVPALVSPTIEAKYLWTLWGNSPEASWFAAPWLRFRRAERSGHGDEIGSCELEYRYGDIKHVHHPGFGTQPPFEMSGWWVRISFAGESGQIVSWVGRVASQTREVLADPDKPSGMIVFTAYGPGYLLQRNSVSEAHVWKTGASKATVIEWMPTMNARDKDGVLVGNRTEDTHGTAPCYYYGDGEIELWNHYQALQYFLNLFMDEGGTDGPTWTIGGQSSILASISSTISFRATQTVAEIVRKLIPRELGIDYGIEQDTSGFVLVVYALQPVDYSFGNVVLLSNPLTTEIDVRQEGEGARVVLEGSQAQRYSGIRVLGQQIVCCCTLQAGNSSQNPDLVPKWSPVDEAAYLQGTFNPADDPEKHDEARRADRFRLVFAALGAPEDWDHKRNMAAPRLTPEGELQFASSGAYQNAIRKTLPWTPLREGHDYRQLPADDAGVIESLGDLLPAAVWLWDREARRYVLAEELGISVSVSQVDWGFLLSASPNHLLAFDDWDGANPTRTEPRYSWQSAVFTFAFKIDQRFKMEVELPAGVTPTGGVLELFVPDAELHFLVPGTVVGVRSEGALQRSPNVHLYELRNDADRLALVMAGALGRYFAERNRARITVKGFKPWAHMLGTMLTVIDEGGDTHNLPTPVTGIEWRAGDGEGQEPQTVLRTGHV